MQKATSDFHKRWRKLKVAREKALSLDPVVVDFPIQGWQTNDCDEFRRAVSAVSTNDLAYVGVGIHGPRNLVGKIALLVGRLARVPDIRADCVFVSLAGRDLQSRHLDLGGSSVNRRYARLMRVQVVGEIGELPIDEHGINPRAPDFRVCLHQPAWDLVFAFTPTSN